MSTPSSAPPQRAPVPFNPISPAPVPRLAPVPFFPSTTPRPISPTSPRPTPRPTTRLTARPIWQWAPTSPTSPSFTSSHIPTPRPTPRPTSPPTFWFEKPTPRPTYWWEKPSTPRPTPTPTPRPIAPTVGAAIAVIVSGFVILVAIALTCKEYKRRQEQALSSALNAPDDAAAGATATANPSAAVDQVNIRLGVVGLMFAERIVKGGDLDVVIEEDDKVSENVAQKKQQQPVDDASSSGLRLSNCAICTERFEKDEIIHSTDCRHHFHQHCIIQWATKHDTCPVCRTTMWNEETYKFLEQEVINGGTRNQIVTAIPS